MKQKNLTILSLLTSFMLLVFAGSALADVTVKFIDATFDVGRTDQIIEMEVTASDPISMFDVVAEMASGGAWCTFTDVTFYLANGTGDEDLTRMNGPTEDIFRLWATNLGSCDPVLDAGTSVVVELTVTIGCDEGIFTISPASPEYPGIEWYIDPFTTVTTTFANSSCGAETVTGVMGTYTVQSNPPSFTNCPGIEPGAELVFGCNDIVFYNFTFEDADLGFCSELLTFDVESGPGQINAVGRYTWPESIGEVGTHNIQVSVTDIYDNVDLCNFIIVITNLPPVVDYCPPGPDVPFDGISLVRVVAGDMAYGSFYGHDQDDPVCPGPIRYYIVDAPAGFVIDSVTGDWYWQTPGDGSILDLVDIELGMTDQVPEDDAFCEFQIRVTALRIEIAKTGEDEFVFQGTYTEVPVYGFVDGVEVGGFDFLLFYDASALTLIEATLGEYLADCDWEYFTYRKGPFGNCGSNCPSGLVRLVGINDVNDGIPHPDQCAWDWGSDSLVIANLKFFVTDDRTYECQYVPIGFYWLDCGDNTISDSTGNLVFVSRYVYWFDRDNMENILLDPDSSPFIAGWQSIVDPGMADCDADPGNNKPAPMSFIDFYMGGVDIACADDIDARGDINLNEIPNEIGDAVLFSNYFIYGPSVFITNLEGQVAATDVNNDGKVLTVGDLVYLIRIITGDAAPYTKIAAYANSVDVKLQNSIGGLAVTTTSDVELGAALFVFNGTGEVVNMTENMNVLSDNVDGQLRVLVYDYYGGSISSGTNEIINVFGDVTLAHAEIVEYSGADMIVNASMKALPTNYAVSQNYPNPFNPTTDISLSLPEAANWSIDIYNVNGQLVKSFSGYDNAGVVTVTIDATGMASGIYFYKSTIGNFIEVHKMVLMK